MSSLVVQGLETSRYLAASYPAELRIRSMRTAQWIAAGIYVIFICLALPMLGPYLAPPSETAIIDTSRQLAWVLPPMLIIAALMSQLSAAVADTPGSGGLFSEASGGHVPRRAGYAAVTVVAILLVWLTNVFELVAIASRAFALYYLVQCIAAWFAAREIADRRRRVWLRLGFIALACGLTAVVLFAIPAESA